jgi:cardiolipin synthase
MPASYQTLAALAILVTHFGCAAATATHALLTKPDPRSAVGWMGVCFLFPLLGPSLYAIFGINRVRARARALRAGLPAVRLSSAPAPPDKFAYQLTRIGDAVTQWPRVGGNWLLPLENGENAFPRMLQAIGGAQHTVWLATYIFETDPVGREFIAALAAAHARGVQVRVLVDGVGEWYSWPHVVPLLRRLGVIAVRFLPPRLLPPRLTLNLRNHRKLLLVDGQTCFLGGMNLGGREVGKGTTRRMSDLHFEVHGPIVEQLAQSFQIDWRFAAGEQLTLTQLPLPAGPYICRVITEGPDEDSDKLLYVILGAISVAHERILIMTPYFIPPPELVSALQAAALRGVDVNIVLPERSNIRYVDFASRRWLEPLLERGVKIHLQRPPFSHSKLLVVDDAYAQIGSANLDPRSLRLNFEIAMEVYGEEMGRELAGIVDAARQRSTLLTKAAAQETSMLARIRNSFCWLFSPYL